VLGLLPVVLGVLLFYLNHELMAPLLSDPRGRFMLGVALLSLMAGITVMFVMIRRSVR
jgi:Flp pilus assembly protein TadB